VKRLLPLPVWVLLLCACAVPPTIQPASTPGKIHCDRFFVHGKWQFLHRLFVRGPGGKSLGLLGATVISTRDQSVKTALMTPEGMVLFAAETGPELAVHQSVPPFDRSGFARGLMADVRMIFLAPPGPAEQGRFKDGAAVCRYRRAEGGWLDAIWADDGNRRIVAYDAAGRRIREVVMERGAPGRGRMVLTASGDADYRIEMEAVEAVRLGE
jgi:hypothetical protein